MNCVTKQNGPGFRKSQRNKLFVSQLERECRRGNLIAVQFHQINSVTDFKMCATHLQIEISPFALQTALVIEYSEWKVSNNTVAQ